MVGTYHINYITSAILLVRVYMCLHVLNCTKIMSRVSIAKLIIMYNTYV